MGRRSLDRALGNFCGAVSGVKGAHGVPAGKTLARTIGALLCVVIGALVLLVTLVTCLVGWTSWRYPLCVFGLGAVCLLNWRRHSG